MHAYRITVEATAPSSEHGDPRRLQINVLNHDDLFKIIEAVRAKNFIDTDKAAALALGLKLFSEVALENRTEPLFAPVIEPLKHFIRELKAIPAKMRSSLLEEAGK